MEDTITRSNFRSLKLELGWLVLWIPMLLSSAHGGQWWPSLGNNGWSYEWVSFTRSKNYEEKQFIQDGELHIDWILSLESFPGRIYNIAVIVRDRSGFPSFRPTAAWIKGDFIFGVPGDFEESILRNWFESSDRYFLHSLSSGSVYNDIKLLSLQVSNTPTPSIEGYVTVDVSEFFEAIEEAFTEIRSVEENQLAITGRILARMFHEQEETEGAEGFSFFVLRFSSY